MNKRFLLTASLALGLVGVFFLLTAARAASGARPANVAPQVWEATAGGGEAEFLVVLTEQADLDAAIPSQHPDREARLRHVHDTLRTTALRSQAPLRAELDAAAVDYRPFYVVNVLVVKGDRALVARLAARSDVARIAANPRIRQPLPTPSPRARGPGREHPPPISPTTTWEEAGVEWNVAQINADDVWALGYTGESVVVAGQDTGYDWDHPALVEQYRGYNGVTATHDYNWHDAIHSAGSSCGADSPEPCDDHGHGTHTMGTIVGDDGGDHQIGVAPGARWIGCRNMDRGYGTPASYIECFEFFLAPYPIGGDPFSDGDPSQAPHVINNSWVCPPSEGCSWETLQETVENVRAAGIMVVASAGNTGSGCGTVQYPLGLYDAAFSIGATNSGDNIASFSSRGPVTADGSGRLKPDLVAPGVNVLSSLPGGGYTTMQGTSMAAPHVAGTAALMWSAAPCLIGDVDATERIIAQTARPRTTTQGCGGDGPSDVPNNVYGWGIVDALAAVEEARPKLEVSKQVAFPEGVTVRSLVYTLNVTNTSCLTFSQVVLTDTVPPGTTFAWASGGYVYADGAVTWTVESLGGWETLMATMAITVEHLPQGTVVVNDTYGVRADELATPVMGAPVEAVIPWRCILPALKDWAPGGNGSE